MNRGNNPHSWERIRQGDPIPEGAVPAGHTAQDGIVYVALSDDGDLGKLNVDRKGNAKQVWCFSSSSPTDDGWVLVKAPEAIAAWRKVSKGHRLPDRAVFAGERFGDDEGPMYVARYGGESGRLLLEQDLVRTIECHFSGSHDVGEVLVFDPCLLPQAICDPLEKAKAIKRKWQARWMWYDAGVIPLRVPGAIVPGPLRGLTQHANPLNSVRWSAWQDLPSTLLDLEKLQNNKHTLRPVRIETADGISDVYEHASDLVLVLRKILTGTGQ